MSKAAAAYETLRTRQGAEQGCGDWLEIGQVVSADRPPRLGSES